MTAQIVIIHGWSDSSDSFHPLRTFLEAHGYQTIQIWLADYISMSDDVRIQDVAKRMDIVLSELTFSGKIKAPFDVITHSTGGLVFREWVTNLTARGIVPPVKRVVMLAPANFGSKLATIGKSMVGRILKGWNNWFQTGDQVLSALELGSPYQWILSQKDLVNPSGTKIVGPYGHGKIWPFVINGTIGYQDGLRQIVNEDGSDGTVRPAAANPNIVGMTIDFSKDPKQPSVTIWPSRVDAPRIPFAVVPDCNHATIVLPNDNKGGFADGTVRLSKLILTALACESDEQYDQIAMEWDGFSEDTAGLSNDTVLRTAIFGGNDPGAAPFHQYMQIFVVARDDQMLPVNDYFLEFYAPMAPGDNDSVFFHREILKDVHTNANYSQFRCLFLDRTDLVDRFYNAAPNGSQRQVAISVSAAPIGPNIRYFDNANAKAVGQVIVHSADLEERAGLPARLRRNTTHLIELVLPRQPLDAVFTLSQ